MPRFTICRDRYAERTVVVSGGARGLGYAVAARVGAEGATVALLDLECDAVDAAAESLRSAGLDVVSFVADVTDEASVGEALERFHKRAGSIDVLVTMAGIFPFAPFDDTTPELWNKVVDTNLGGTYLCARAAYSYMQEQKYGRIVTVSSGALLLGAPGLSAYLAAKSGVIGLTRALAREGGPHGITANAVLPGLVATEHALSMREDIDELFDTVVAGQCVPRRGHPDDIAEAVAFLASEGSQFVTGQSLYVGGGDRFI
jgi:NAD(P)-dependent dehydrogenase (short-subunit alcohol dehydrogenase family)